MFYSVGAAVTKYHKLAYEQQKCICYSSGGWKYKIKVPAWVCFDEGPLPGSSVHFSSVAQLCPTLCNPMNSSTPGLPVHHQLPEFTQTHVHRVSDAIQPSHPLLSPSPPSTSSIVSISFWKSLPNSLSLKCEGIFDPGEAFCMQRVEG